VVIPGVVQVQDKPGGLRVAGPQQPQQVDELLAVDVVCTFRNFLNKSMNRSAWESPLLAG
jgi:hypothetical protein